MVGKKILKKHQLKNQENMIMKNLQVCHTILFKIIKMVMKFQKKKIIIKILIILLIKLYKLMLRMFSKFKFKNNQDLKNKNLIIWLFLPKIR